jgi:hypothetical protein
MITVPDTQKPKKPDPYCFSLLLQGGGAVGAKDKTRSVYLKNGIDRGKVVQYIKNRQLLGSKLPGKDVMWK